VYVRTHGAETVGGVTIEQAVTLPRVTEIRFRNSGNTDAANCCQICPSALGVGAGGTARNRMELRFRIDGHRAGFEYDITRTRRDSLWQRVGGPWARLVSLSYFAGTMPPFPQIGVCIKLSGCLTRLLRFIELWFTSRIDAGEPSAAQPLPVGSMKQHSPCWPEARGGVRRTCEQARRGWASQSRTHAGLCADKLSSRTSAGGSRLGGLGHQVAQPGEQLYVLSRRAEQQAGEHRAKRCDIGSGDWDEVSQPRRQCRARRAASEDCRRQPRCE